jgi:hypothetical protein
MNGGTVIRNTGISSGGGLSFATGTAFTMTGGTISDNSTSELGGAGVNVAGDFTMSGGAIMSNRAVQMGGGVAVYNGATFLLTGGTITGNIAGMQGGGVSLITPASSFTMRGGTIAGNTGASGGGVAVQSGTFKKVPATSGGSSGVIYGNDGGDNSNTATLAASTLQSHGHAVYVAGSQTRETTVTAYQQLDSTVVGADGGWTE